MSSAPRPIRRSVAANMNLIFGVVRGGAQPIDLGDRFLTLAHSSYKMSDTLRYYACMVYEIARTAPFAVTRCANVPFTLPSDQDSGSFSLAKLNPAVGSVIYPCGIVRVGEDVLITYGINDERAAIARMPLQSLLDMLVPVKVATSRSTANFTLRHDQRTQVSKYVPGLFWWNAVQKSFDGKFGNRNFSIGNFGDIASRDIVERVSGLTTRCCTVGGPKLLAVGSIMHNARDGDVVWGSGVKGTHRTMHESVKTLDVRAVRGPLSADTLRSQGFDMSKVSHVFDPGCLVAHLFASEIAAYDVGRNDHLGSIRVVPRRCCTTLIVEDSQRESMRLEGRHDEALTRPLSHDELAQLQRRAEEARLAADLAGQGDGLACAA